MSDASEKLASAARYMRDAEITERLGYNAGCTRHTATKLITEVMQTLIDDGWVERNDLIFGEVRELA